VTAGFEATVGLGTGADAPASARRYLQALLVERGRQDLVERALLLASELVTNAVLHGTGTVTMTARLGPVLRVEVRDGGARPPVLRRPPPESVTGRGLQLVDRFAVRWGHVREREGKCVWFELDHTQVDAGRSRRPATGRAGGTPARPPAPPATAGGEDQACA
jgi:hypothetical protein